MVSEAAARFGAHRREVGFVMRLSLERAEQRGELYVEPHGAAYVWHRRDGQTTLHVIVSEAPGTGQALLARIVADARVRGQRTLLARCPTDLASNAWYARRGFHLEGTESGRRRALNVWVLDLEPAP